MVIGDIDSNNATFFCTNSYKDIWYLQGFVIGVMLNIYC